MRTQHTLSPRIVRNQHTVRLKASTQLLRLLSHPRSLEFFLVIHQVRRLIARGESQVLIRNSDGNITRYTSSALCGDSICSPRV